MVPFRIFGLTWISTACNVIKTRVNFVFWLDLEFIKPRLRSFCCKEIRVSCFDIEELLDNAHHRFSIVGTIGDPGDDNSEDQLHPTDVS